VTSSLRMNDRQELERTKKQVLQRLARPSRSLRYFLRKLDLADLSATDIQAVIEHLLHTDRYYYHMSVSISRHAAKKAYRRRRMMSKAVQQLHSDGKILTMEGHIVHPSVLAAIRAVDSSDRPKRRKKFDQRPYHGRPGRDRGRLPQYVAA